MAHKIATIVGARPQFIKASTISRNIKNDVDLEEFIINTDQHYDPEMSADFFSQLQIPDCKYHLNINQCSHGQMTGNMLIEIEKILIYENPKMVIVYGDTNSTLAGALAAAKLHIPIAHVEAGLRSFNKRMPEEINRILTDHMSSLLLCPTRESVYNLHNENLVNNVFNVGDVMKDAVLHAKKIICNDAKYLPVLNYEHEFAFFTLHRAESTDNIDIFDRILSYVEEFAFNNNLHIVFPVHPRTRSVLEKYNRKYSDKIIMVPPINYFEAQAYISKAKYVLTDSGGIQKEAYFHQVPCITLRNETEWVETIEAGWNRLWSEHHYKDRHEIDDYGAGDAAINCINKIKEFL